MKKKIVSLVLSTIMVMSTWSGTSNVNAEITEESQVVRDIISAENYSLQLKKQDDNSITFTVRNIGSEDIKNLKIDIKTNKEPQKSNLGNVEKNYEYVTVNSTYTLHGGYSKKIVVKFENNIELSDIDNVSIMGDRVIEDGEYDNILFKSTVNPEYTEQVFGLNEKNILVNKGDDNSNIKVKIEKEVGNDEYNYKGRISAVVGKEAYDADVTGDLFVSEEGVLGTLVGKTSKNEPISATINYTNVNENPYVFMSIGDATKGDDRYLIFGNRKETNDELSDEKIEQSGNTEFASEQSLENCDSMIIQNSEDNNIESSEEKLYTISEAASAYDTVFQGMVWGGYNYKGKFYPLVSTCLYSPSKQKSNCTYCDSVK